MECIKCKKEIPISTHAPAGGATPRLTAISPVPVLFLLTPLREGRRKGRIIWQQKTTYFYSRPCGRGD